MKEFDKNRKNKLIIEELIQEIVISTKSVIRNNDKLNAIRKYLIYQRIPPPMPLICHYHQYYHKYNSYTERNEDTDHRIYLYFKTISRNIRLICLNIYSINLIHPTHSRYDMIYY